MLFGLCFGRDKQCQTRYVEESKIVRDEYCVDVISSKSKKNKFLSNKSKFYERNWKKFSRGKLEICNT